MKRIDFNSEECAFLKQLISNCIEEYSEIKEKDQFEFLIGKFNSNFLIFDRNEIKWLKNFTQHWLNNNNFFLENLFDKYYHKNPLLYLYDFKEDESLMILNDLVYNIRKKLNVENLVFIEYKKVFLKIEKLKSIENYYISLSSDKPYRIYFLDNKNKEFLKWELDSNYNFEQTEFVKIKDYDKEKFKNLILFNRNDALSIFKNYNNKNENMIFCEHLLNF